MRYCIFLFGLLASFAEASSASEVASIKNNEVRGDFAIPIWAKYEMKRPQPSTPPKRKLEASSGSGEVGSGSGSGEMGSGSGSGDYSSGSGSGDMSSGSGEWTSGSGEVSPPPAAVFNPPSPPPPQPSPPPPSADSSPPPAASSPPPAGASSPPPSASPSPPPVASPPPPPLYQLVTSFTAEGDLSDYDGPRRNQIRQLFATEASVPLNAVDLLIEAASVLITVTITVDTAEVLDAVNAALEPVLASAEAATTFLAPAGVDVLSTPTIALSTDSSSDDNSLALGLGLGLGLGLPIVAVVIFVVLKGTGGMSTAGVTKADKKGGGVEMNQPTSAV